MHFELTNEYLILDIEIALFVLGSAEQNPKKQQCEIRTTPTITAP